jgi:thioredoxin-related protein
MIRRTFLGCLSALFGSFCVPVEAQVFLTLEVLSYEDAIILSKEQNKKLFLFFTADYCGWCHKQKQVIMEQEVLDVLQNYIVCFVDTTKREDLSKKYKVKTIPAYFVIDTDGQVLRKNVGYKEKQDFLVWLNGQTRTLFRR